MTISLATAAANAEANATGPLANSGSIKIYAGTVPANANASLGGATLLASLAMSATAFGSASSGTITANAITSTNAVATGTATFFRMFKSDGTTVVMQGTVGTSGADLNLSTAAIQINAAVSISSLTYTRS